MGASSVVDVWSSVSKTSSAVAIDVTRLNIGKQTNNAVYYHYFNGFADEIRVVKGVCLYTAAFTPPTSGSVVGLPVVDVWDSTLNSWSKKTLSQSRKGATVTSFGKYD